jgi:hypothetical protein
MCNLLLTILISIVLLAGSMDFFALQELTKFINQCNEIKAANLASKEGGDLNIVKADGEESKSKKQEARN